MRKFLALMLAVLMVLSLCTACGETNSDDGTITLTWYVPGDKQPDTALVMEELNKITMEKIGCKIDMQFIDTGSFQERMNMNMASGSEYDLAFVGYLNTFKNAAAKGGLMELDDLLKKAPKIQETIPQYILNSGIYNGKIYAIPNMQITASVIAFSTPKDFADEYGLDTTNFRDTEDFEPYMDWILANKKNVIPLRHNWNVGTFRSLDEGTDKADPMYVTNYSANLYKAVVDRENKTFKAVFGFETDHVRERAEKLHEYYKKGYIRADVDSVMDDSAEMKQKRYGLMMNVYKPGMDAELANNLGYETVSTVISRVVMGTADSTMIGIGKNCKHPEEAIKFIELINTDKEAYNLVCFGIEGKHYTKTGEDSIEYIENSGYKPNASWKFGNQFNAYRLPGQIETVWEETRELNDLANENNKKNPSVEPLGFTFIQDDIMPVITKVTEVKNKYKFLGTGTKDPDEYWDTMVEELYAAGLQDIIDEYQRQLDKFVADNPDKMAQIEW